MENTFRIFKETEVKKYSELYYENEKDIEKLLSMGILIKDGNIKLNPIVKRSKSVSTARKKIKNILDSWLNNLEFIDDAQNRFRYDMVEYFKNNPIGFVHNGYANMPEDTPENYKSGNGYAYILNGEIVSLHVGFKPPSNTPEGCDRFKYTSNLGMIQIV